MSNNFAELQQADRRLVTLKLLAESAGYCSNEHLLRTLLGSLGHAVGAERLRADLVDLQEMGLITSDGVAGVTLATLTEKGLDVANGAVTVPGVKRPMPGR